MTKNKKLNRILPIILTTMIYIVYVFLCWYGRPLDEKLVCNYNYDCKVLTTRYFNTKISKEFSITNNSTMTSVYSFNHLGRRFSKDLLGRLYFIHIDGNEIFSTPVCDSYADKEYCEEFVNSVIMDFDKYKHKQVFFTNYTLISRARKESKILFWLDVTYGTITWIITILYFLTHQTKRKNKEKKGNGNVEEKQN